MQENSPVRYIGKYMLESRIGKGGMAEVYKVRDTKTGEIWALKLLMVDEKEPARTQRFEQEMKIYSKLQSKYIAKFVGGAVRTNPPYMVMEYVDGVILKNYIANSGGHLNHKEAARIARDMAEGFSEIHANGVIHRDIKNSNILIDKEGNVKIIDFGIALNENAQRHTSTGKIVASVHYIAPELLSKQEPSIKSDIYALGILLFEMLVGNPPFKGSNPLEIASKHQSQPLPDISKFNPEVPVSLINIVIKATAKDPEKRFSSMREFKLALEKYDKPRKPLSGYIEPQNTEKKGFFGRLFKGKK